MTGAVLHRKPDRHHPGGSLQPDYIGEHEAAVLVRVIEESIEDGVVTRDMSGAAGTSKAGMYIAESVRKGE